MKMNLLVLCVSFLFSLASYAGNERGNGGSGVVCRNYDGTIKSAELLDIYEGKALLGLKYSSLQGSIEEKYKSIIEDIYGKVLSPTEYMIFQHIKESFVMLPDGVELEPINDSRQIIIPRGCKIEQVANFYNMRSIYIVSDIYSKFTDLDKLGLLLHEALYYLDRQGGVKDSRHTRRSVAHLLSNDFKAEAVLDGVDQQNDLFCTTIIQQVPNGYTAPAPTMFWATKSGTDSWRFQFVKLNGHTIFSKKYADLAFGSGAFPLSKEEETDLSGTVISTSSMTSKIDGFEGLSITLSNGVINTPFGNKFMALTWSGFDPDDRIFGNIFTCQKRNSF
jgi:hypothetical protein